LFYRLQKIRDAIKQF